MVQDPKTLMCIVCFTQLILSMRKESKNCNTLKEKYMKEFTNKFGYGKEISLTQTSLFDLNFIKNEGVEENYFGVCIHNYKTSTATIQMTARIVYKCLPILQDYIAFQNESLKYPSLEEDFYNHISYKYQFWWMNKNMIDVCKDYGQCPWSKLETIPSQDFFDPKASQSEVTRAKETYLALHGEGSQTIDACFTSLVLSMRKKMQDCNSMFTKFKKAIQESGMKAFVNTSETNSETFGLDFWNQIGGASKVSPEDFGGCLSYKETFMDAKNQLFKSLSTVDATSKLAFKIVSCIISIFGLVGNLAMFVIYFRKDRKVRFNSLMLLITSFDFFFIVFGMVQVAIHLTESGEDQPTLAHRGSLAKIVQFLYSFTFTGSVYTTTLVVIERYLILCKQKYVHNLCW